MGKFLLFVFVAMPLCFKEDASIYGWFVIIYILLSDSQSSKRTSDQSEP